MGARAVEPDERVKRFAAKVRTAMPDARIIWFGSRARGDHMEYSDYDFIVISERFAGMPFTRRPVLLYDLWEHDADLEPLCYTREEFERKASQITIVAEAVREGVEV
jgi:predicted nucleotidyltransferase